MDCERLDEAAPRRRGQKPKSVPNGAGVDELGSRHSAVTDHIVEQSRAYADIIGRFSPRHAAGEGIAAPFWPRTSQPRGGDYHGHPRSGRGKCRPTQLRAAQTGRICPANRRKPDIKYLNGIKYLCQSWVSQDGPRRPDGRSLRNEHRSPAYHFRISASMLPYVLRLRLRGWDFDFLSDPKSAATFTECVEEMRRILMQKGVRVFVADRAISKTLEHAVDFQLTEERYRALKVMDAQSEATLDRLISCLRRFSDALARLPPTSKGELSRRVSAILGKPQFDTEVFIELVDAVAATLPSLSPQKLADDVLSIIQPEPGEGKRSPLVDDWEAMPATTRVKVERKIQSNRPMSLARWLGNVADLLARERPVRKRGTPRSIMWVFASRAAAIWRTLGLNPGRAYNFFLYPGTNKKIGHGGRV